MPLTGKAKGRSASVIDKIAEELGCEPAVIDAIVTVEAVGQAYDPLERLIVRPELHKIASCPYLNESERKRAVKLGFTKPLKMIDYTRDPILAGDQRWAWLDKFRMTFGDEAAYWITSFGAPQIMGFNHHLCGYDLPSTMVQAFADGEDAQLTAMCRFLKSAGLVPALRARQWKQIARKYNGAAYAKNSYDTKLRAAYEASRYKKGSVLHVDDDVLEYGDKGSKVKMVQERLRALGFFVDTDGDFGEETKDAVMAFQRRNALTVDGRVGPLTQKMLETAAPKEQNTKPIKKILAESETAKAGVGTMAMGGISLATAFGSAGTSATVPDVSLESLNTVAVQAERGVSVAQKVFALGTDKILLALGLFAVIFGAVVLYRRIQAQRLRKVG
jgi:peptidoglycan hydrolase-like protein with peptidoglycan-binding domain